MRLFLIAGLLAGLLAAASERPRIGWDPFTTPHSTDGHEFDFVDCGQGKNC